MATSIEEIDALRAKQGEFTTRLQEIDSEHSGRALPADAQDEYDRIRQEYLDGEKLIGELTLRSEQLEELSVKPEHQDEVRSTVQFHTSRPGATRGADIWDLSTVRASLTSPEAMTRELGDRGKRAIEDTTPSHEGIRKEQAQEHLERLRSKLDGEAGSFSRHLLTTGSPTYRRAFAKLISGRGVSTDEANAVEFQRALNLTGETGGYLLPYTLDPTIIPTSNGVVNPLRAISRVEQTTTNVWKGATSGGMTAKFRESETEESTDDSPKFAQPEVEAHAADAFAQWSFEFGQDYGSIEGELATLVQDAKDELEATKLYTGSGEKEPFGLATGADTLIETVGSKAFAVADLYALEEALPPRFRPRGQWVGNRSIYNRTRQFDTAGGASLWVTLKEGLANDRLGNMAQRLLGYPTNELSTMESKLTAKKTILYFGDFRYFLIADRIGMVAKPIDNLTGKEGRPTGQAGLYFFWRVGSKVLSKNAFRGLSVKE